MHVDALSGVTGALVKAALDTSQLRHQVHATNIAHAGVPGHVPMRVSFDGEMARLAESARAGMLASAAAPEGRLEPARDTGGAIATAVAVDAEATEIAQNTLHYQALLRGLGRHLALLGAAIGDSRR